MEKEVNRLRKQTQNLRVQLGASRGDLQRMTENMAQLRTHYETLNRVVENTSYYEPQIKANTFSGLSIVVCAFDIPKQIQRTLQSCSPFYQSAEPGTIEVIVIDNGSSPRVRLEDLKPKFPFISKVIRVDGHPSPVFGLNQGIEAAKYDLVAVLIDGAHILTPGIYRHAKSVFELMARPVISVPQYYLGDVSQNLYTPADAFQEEERLLKDMKWPNNGYNLFRHATIPGEEHQRTVFNYSETNCLITTREIFSECGGFNEEFDEPGAGLANFEIFKRLTNHPNNEYVLLAGEGTFHQNHDGITTGASLVDRKLKVEKYFEKFERITGNRTLNGAKPPFVYGQVTRDAQNVDVISQEYKKAKIKIGKQLSKMFVRQAEMGLIHNAPEPSLTLKPEKLEYEARVRINPLGLLDSIEDTKPYNYLNIIKDVHEHIGPELYFEIGIHEGHSLGRANCYSIGVDPEFNIRNTLSAPTRLFRETSDAFFANKARANDLFKNGIDLAFIDGMHLAEFALRDFMNTEKYMKPDGVVIIDDILPEQAIMMERERTTAAWCGDVFKVISILKQFRPDLVIKVTNAFIGPYRKGLAIISNLDPNSTILDEQYEDIERGILGDAFDADDPKPLEDVFGLISPFEFSDWLKARQV